MSIIPLIQGVNEDAYINIKRGVPDKWYWQPVAWFIRLLLKYQLQIARWDVKRLKMKEGEIFPRTSLTYWWGRPLLWLCIHGWDVEEDFCPKNK
jgi:hypothetical protein